MAEVVVDGHLKDLIALTFGQLDHRLKRLVSARIQADWIEIRERLEPVRDEESPYLLQANPSKPCLVFHSQIDNWTNDERWVLRRDVVAMAKEKATLSIQERGR